MKTNSIVPVCKHCGHEEASHFTAFKQMHGDASLLHFADWISNRGATPEDIKEHRLISLLHCKAFEQ